jgi:MFS family permease
MAIRQNRQESRLGWWRLRADYRSAPRRHVLPFSLLAAAMLLMMVASNLPVSLLGLYQVRWRLSPLDLTIVYGVYLFALNMPLLLLGRVGDAAGRRLVLLPSLALACVGILILAFAQGFGWLIAGRLVQALAAGAFSSCAVAALTELHPSPNRTRAAWLASLVAVQVTLLGLGLGPLVSGLAAAYAPWPTVTPYLIELAALLPILLLAFFLLPESRPLPGTRQARLETARLPSGSRVSFALAAWVGMIGWAIGSSLMGLVPLVAATLPGVHGTAFGGAAVFSLLVSAALVLLAFRNLTPRPAMSGGLIAEVVGLLLFQAALAAGRPDLFIAAAVLAGVGLGAAYMGAQGLVNQIAPGSRRGELLASLTILFNLAAGGTVLLLGVDANRFGLRAAFILLAVAGGSGGVLAAGVMAVFGRSSRLPAHLA